MKKIPVCPKLMKDDSYGYSVADDRDNFTLWCDKAGTHRGAGLSSDERWPQYTPEKGLILNKNQ